MFLGDTSDVWVQVCGRATGKHSRMQTEIRGLPGSPVLHLNGQPVANIEAPMCLRRAELQAMIERCHR